MEVLAGTVVDKSGGVSGGGDNDDDEDGGGVVVVGRKRGWETARGGEWYGDRVDREMRIVFGFGQKSSPEKFSDGGVVVAGEGGGAAENGEGDGVDVCVFL
ncbi:hypothetical protein Tco_0135567 [Tanacetum coccineum]